MDSFNPTTKTQAAISSAVQAASMAGNPDVTAAHLLGALLAQGDGIAAPLLAAVGADAAAVRAELEAITQRLPSATGSTVAAPLFDRQALKALTDAQNLATEMGDSYVSTEHLLVGLAAQGGAVGQLLSRHGATPDALREAFQASEAQLGWPARTRRTPTRRWPSTAWTSPSGLVPASWTR